MVRRRAFLLLKRSALDLYTNIHRDSSISSLVASGHPAVGNMIDRHKKHEATVNFCRSVLSKKSLEFQEAYRDELISPINDVDLVITIGGDGTLLQASHYMDGSVPVLGVNSDPTDASEVDEHTHSYDATRSTGYLCGATAETFEQVVDDILEGKKEPSVVSRILICIDGICYRTLALNDVLIAHPSPAAVSRFSFRIIKSSNDSRLPVIHSRSSGLRVCTAVGSTAAMQSAGGFPMHILSRNLQYMVREPILLHDKFQSQFMHGWVQEDELLNIFWGCRQGFIYIDGSHVYLPIKCGNMIQISSKGHRLPLFVNNYN